MKHRLTLLLACALASGCVEIRTRGPAQIDARSFVQPPAHAGQNFGAGFSAKADPEFSFDLDDGHHAFVARPFLRFDAQDTQRTHVDIRQLSYTFARWGFEAGGGVGLFHWGNLESSRVNDIVNQIDFVEDVTQREKLGQPYARLRYGHSFDILGGTDLAIEGMYLPFQRERTFPGPQGRLRPSIPVQKRPEYESPLGAFHPGLATRASLTVWQFDFSLVGYSGTSRDPRFKAQFSRPEGVAHYDLLQQVGLNTQFSYEGFVAKLELAGRLYGKALRPSLAAAAGVEYTYFDLFSWGADVTGVAEYTLDYRAPHAPKTVLQNDAFVGGRVALNDDGATTFEGGLVGDLSTVLNLDVYSASARLSASRRVINEHFRLIGELQVFAASDSAFDWFLAKDSFGQVSVAYFF